MAGSMTTQLIAEYFTITASVNGNKQFGMAVEKLQPYVMQKFVGDIRTATYTSARPGQGHH